VERPARCGHEFGHVSTTRRGVRPIVNGNSPWKLNVYALCQGLFFAQKSLLGGPAPVRRFLPHLMKLVLERKIEPGKVFDLMLPLADVAEGYRAMDERRAIKTLLRV
jgi:threonine dehydrogenase-like Zn-dependent dehydrogenase